MENNNLSLLLSESNDFEISSTSVGDKFPREIADKLLSSYSSKSLFEDNKWIINKINLPVLIDYIKELLVLILLID